MRTTQRRSEHMIFQLLSMLFAVERTSCAQNQKDMLPAAGRGGSANIRRMSQKIMPRGRLQ